MLGIQAIQPQDFRPFGELFVQCEIEAMASRIAAAVADFFEAVAQFIIESCSALRDRVVELLPNSIAALFDPIAEAREIIAEEELGIPADEREDFLGFVLPLLNERMDEWEKREIIRKVAEIPTIEREAAIAHALTLITQEMSGFGRKMIVEIITRIPAQERESVVALAHLLLTQEGLVWHAVEDIVEVILAIPVREREGIGLLIPPLITEEMSEWNKRAILTAIAAIPAGSRADVALHVRPLITEGRGQEFSERIIQAVAAIPADQRADVIRHSRALITPEMRGNIRAMNIQAVAAVPENERAELVRRRLLDPDRFNPPADLNPDQRNEQLLNPFARLFNNFQRIPPRDNIRINNLHNEGVGVHAGRRDQLTGEAIELFYRHQGAIEVERIDQAMADFLNYLGNSAAFNNQQKQRVRNALFTPQVPGEAFGPLIEAGGFLAGNGFRVDGKEFIARLWIFSSELEGGEEFNAKDGIISALNNCHYEFGGGRICNLGKSQHLVIAVLQGRLAGVNIEGDVIPRQVTTEQAEAMFFNVEARRLIGTLVELLATANRFCDENPGVNRQDFIRRMHEYAEVQGIE